MSICRRQHFMISMSKMKERKRKDWRNWRRKASILWSFRDSRKQKEKELNTVPSSQMIQIEVLLILPIFVLIHKSFELIKQIQIISIIFMISSKIQTRLAPSILSADFSILYEDAKRMIDNGVDSLHIDMMDGHFVPNLTIGPPVAKCLRKRMPGVHFDVHLNLQKPHDYILPLKQAQVDHITFYYESTYPNLVEMCKQIRSHGMSVGLSIKPATELNQQILDLIRSEYLDVLLIMTVEPGFGGQKLMAGPLQKIRALRKEFPQLNIQCDGGILHENIQSVVEAGANYIVSGSGIYDAKDYKETIKHMQSVLKKHFH